mgnify:CR=1 FL=1
MQRLGLRQQLCGLSLEHGVAALSQHKRHLFGVTEGMHFRCAEVTISAQKERHRRPGLAQIGHHPLENQGDLFPRRTHPGTQNRGDQLTALPFVDMQRHETTFPIIRIEQRALLRAMGGIIRVIYIQDKRFGRRLVGGDKAIGQRLRHAIQMTARHPVLQPTHRRLTGQIVPRQRRPLTPHLESRIAAQIITIVGILIPLGDLKHPLTQQILQRVIHIPGIASIMDRLRKAMNQPDSFFDRAQKQHPCIAGDIPPIKLRFHALTRNRGEVKRHLRFGKHRKLPAKKRNTNNNQLFI